jgi:hypothetical protein
MREGLWMIVCSLGLLILAGGCPFSGWGNEYQDGLVAGYYVCAIDAIEEAAICLECERSRGGVEVVGPMVFAYGWNDDFIIAKQRPSEYGKMSQDVVCWYIIDVLSRKVHGPLNEDGFWNRRAELGVPGGLSFTKEIPRKGGRAGSSI